MMKLIAYSKILLLILCCFVVVSADAKKRKKKKTKTASPIVKVDSTKVSPNTVSAITIDSIKTKNQQETKPLAQLVVSFVSRGSGIDGKARNEFLAIADQFNTKHNIQLMYDVKPWGREGEVDYCFIGNNEILMLQFYTQLKEKLGGYNRVFVKQNTPCK